MFRMRDIEYTYDDSGTRINLNDFEAVQGEQWLVIGPSGCGKTTLLHLLAGLVRPQKGTLTICETDVLRLSEADVDIFRGKEIGIVFQDDHLLKSLDVAQNLSMPYFVSGQKIDHGKIEQVLAQLGISDLRSRFPEELSKGQAQRVSIARALMKEPKLILADEPSSNLDDENAAQMLSLLSGEARRIGATLVVVTHDSRIRSSFENLYEMKAL